MSGDIADGPGAAWMIHPSIKFASVSCDIGWDWEVEMGKRTDEGLQGFFVRMTPDLHEALRARADEEERSMAQVIRRALRQYVAEPQPA